MKPHTYFRNAVSVTITEEDARIIHAALEYSPAHSATQTRLELEQMLKQMRRFRRRYERKDAPPQPKYLDRELFPAWVS